jgi:hypothetical protein
MADQTTVSYDRRKDVSSLILESHHIACREDYAIDLHASIKTTGKYQAVNLCDPEYRIRVAVEDALWRRLDALWNFWHDKAAARDLIADPMAAKLWGDQRCVKGWRRDDSK